MKYEQHKPRQPSVGSPKRWTHEAIAATCTCNHVIKRNFFFLINHVIKRYIPYVWARNVRIMCVVVYEAWIPFTEIQRQ